MYSHRWMPPLQRTIYTSLLRTYGPYKYNSKSISETCIGCKCHTKRSNGMATLTSRNHQPSTDGVLFNQSRALLTKSGFNNKKVPNFEEDNVPSDSEIIYERSMANLMIKFHLKQHAFTLVFSSCIIVSYYGLTDGFLNLTTVPLLGEIYEVYVTAALVSCIWLTIPPLIIQKINRQAVVRIYTTKDADRFIAILRDGLFSTTKVEFHVDDVTATARKKSFHGNALLHGRKIGLYKDDFVKPCYLNKILGYESKEKVNT